MKNALVIGCGSKFGAEISNQLARDNYCVYGISSSVSSENILHIDWDTINNQNVEKFLRNLPVIDLIIFNQNYVSLTNSCFEFGQDHIFNIWKQSKKWTQSHYVNCVLPMYILHTISDANKLSKNATVAWMLSSIIFSEKNDLVDYKGQKYQNYICMKKYAATNQQTFVGICPGLLEKLTYVEKSKIFVEFLIKNTLTSGEFYKFDNTINQFNSYEKQDNPNRC
jgi:hypothetical protein